MYQKQTLSNGLRLLTAPMPQVKSVTALVMVEAGSRYETKKTNGLSHFLEHMIFKGTKKRPSSLAISSLIDGIGGAFNAFTSKEYTGFYVKAAREHLELILDVLSDMLLNSLLSPKELDKERGVIIEEINMYEDQPQSRVWELFEQLLYGKSPLAWRVSGEKENIRQISRPDMLRYINKMYHSRAIVIGLAGDLRLESRSSKLEFVVSKYFADVPKGRENAFLKADDAQKRPQSLTYYKKTDQAHLVLGVRGYPLDHPNEYPLSVLTTILGGNMSSRLWLEVREKRGLAYYVHSGSDFFHDCGYFTSAAGLRLGSVEDAIKVILEQFGKLTAKFVSAEELARAKDFLKGRMILRLEDSYHVASFYTSQELLKKKIETPEEVLAKIDKVTAEDIQRVAKDIFKTQKLNLAIIGPFKGEGKFSKLLKI